MITCMKVSKLSINIKRMKHDPGSPCYHSFLSTITSVVRRSTLKGNGKILILLVPTLSNYIEHFSIEIIYRIIIKNWITFVHRSSYSDGNRSNILPIVIEKISHSPKISKNCWCDSILTVCYLTYNSFTN